MNILSWNVLFREYEETYNPNSSILKEWKNESEREDKIIKILKENSDDNSIILLQEVSQNLLEKIMNSFQEKQIFSYNVRSNEFLVTITMKEIFEKELIKQHDTANGYLSIVKNNLRIINTHLIPQRYCKINIMDYLLKLPNESNLIICGDFNETYKNVCSFLEKRYIIPYFGSTYKNKKQIDYIIFDNKNIKHKIVKVLTNNISDHNLIKIVLT
jgi:hypothetical protein